MAFPPRVNYEHSSKFEAYMAHSEELQVSDYLKTIIENKVNGVALTCFQCLVHWFLTTFSCCHSTYNKLYDQKMQKATQAHTLSKGNQVLDLTSKKQVHTFPNGNQVLDLTSKKIVSIQTIQRNDTGLPVHFILLNGKKVIFDESNSSPSLWYGDNERSNVIVENAGTFPYEIDIRQEKRTDLGTLISKTWRVNLTVIFERTTTLEAGVEPKEEVYVVEQIRLGINKNSAYLREISRKYENY
jgi:hypothetical protein